VNALLVAIGAGSAIAFGLWALAGTLLPVRPRLADALDLLDGSLDAPDEPAGAGLDRLGGWLRTRLRRPVPAATLRRLRMAGRSVDRHFAQKALTALAGLLLPGLVGVVLAVTIGAGAEVPAVVGLLLGVVGFLLPDVLLRGADTDRTEDATEALLTYFDLVTLERLANASGSQALRSAAAVSDVTVFVAIRDALERARLEQRVPYPELQRLGRDLALPALVDIADVMALDEAGAALSGALRARVRELRDAHLTQAKIAAAAVSERMAFFMVIPSLVFGLFFLVPPVLRLLDG
jgi:Flp pilus assembly protein TadB